MDRSQSLRSQRIANSPYKRPHASSSTKKTTSPLSTLKSIYSYVTAPFSRSPTLPTIRPTEDAKSESGSEDHWDGSPPNDMTDQDVFTLAAAGGREGPEFERRAMGWRGSQAPRKQLEPFNSLEIQPRTPVLPALSLGLRPSASMPAFTSQSLKRPLASRAPLPAPFHISSSPSTAALTAFLDAKKGSEMTFDDFHVMETLMDNMKSEAGSPPKSVGGWSAGNSRSVKPLPSTPSRQITPAPSTPTAGFSLGRDESSRRITYLGPGMSPRRMLPKARGTVRSLFTGEPEDSEPKRQRVAEVVPDVTLKGKERAIEAESPPRDVVTEGKKRAAEIMMELIGDDIAKPANPDFIIINPYDTGTRQSSTKSATPQGSILRSSLRSSTSTPLRGAAAKLEANKQGRKLTTLEILEGKRPWADKPRVRIQTPPIKDDEEVEVDELLPEPEPAAAPTPDVYGPTIPPVEPFPALAVPSIQMPARPLPAQSTPQFETFASPSQEAIIAASRHESVPPNTFATTSSLRSRSPSPPDLAEVEDTLKRTARSKLRYLSARDTASYFDYHALPFYAFDTPTPAKDESQAKRIARMMRDDSLEIFHFFAVAPPVIVPPATAWTCELCMLQNPPMAIEKCTICEAPKPVAVPAMRMPVPSGQNWKCNVCDLRNPITAREKCMICEAPKPAAKEEEWICGMCMLKNPASAREQCQICETKR